MKVSLLSTAACLVVMACTPVIDQRGYLPDPELESKIAVGDDTKTTIQQRLGYPSTEATFGNTAAGSDAWYYISQTEKQVAFFTPTVQQRSILAVYFDKGETVQQVADYGLKDGVVVNYYKSETPARGKDLGLVEQLFGNLSNRKMFKDQRPGGAGGIPGPGL